MGAASTETCCCRCRTERWGWRQRSSSCCTSCAPSSSTWIRSHWTWRNCFTSRTVSTYNYTTGIHWILPFLRLATKPCKHCTHWVLKWTPPNFSLRFQGCLPPRIPIMTSASDLRRLSGSDSCFLPFQVSIGRGVCCEPVSWSLRCLWRRPSPGLTRFSTCWELPPLPSSRSSLLQCFTCITWKPSMEKGKSKLFPPFIYSLCWC